MNLYKKCLSLTGNTLYSEDGMDSSDLDIVSANESCLSMSRFLEKRFNESFFSGFADVYYISDIHLPHKVTNKFQNPTMDSKIRSYIKTVVKEMFSEDLRVSLSSGKTLFVIFGGDISSSFELSKIFYTEFKSLWDKIYEEFRKQRDKDYIKNIKQKELPDELLSRTDEKYIYAVLGNHEFWDFDNPDSCYSVYRELFQSLGIIFLENTLHDICNTVVVGGTGFAGQNTNLNACMKLYNLTLNREQEIKQSQIWEESYNKALNLAREKNKPLMVITHNPISDWKQNSQPDDNCTYFNGHTHRNYLYHDDERNIHIYANNQIGYQTPIMRLRKAYMYERANPFAFYDDGYYEVNTANYLKFYDYMGEQIAGNKPAERQIDKNNAKFFMVKHKGYYGFFVISSTMSYICAGGLIKKIKKGKDIEEINKDFLRIINRYLTALDPYRSAQEKISKAVNSFGGNGNIHGCIVDIDFFNHVMLNPSDGKITYYHSPKFGYIEPYENLLALLENHNKDLAERYRRRISPLENTLTTQSQMAVSPDLIKIDIKSSIYTVSNRINQIQRLFDKKILREWNEDLLLIGEYESFSVNSY